MVYTKSSDPFRIDLLIDHLLGSCRRGFHVLAFSASGVMMILSVSRRTDIPAYYSGWFFARLREGFVLTRNPMNPSQISHISLDTQTVDCMVFWSKNPRPMMGRLGELGEIPFYFQFTLNDYDREIEPGLPDLAQRLDTFRRLAEMLGPDRVVWRYDPILLSSANTKESHSERFDGIARALCGYATRVVISFLDPYKKIERRLAELGVHFPGDEEKSTLAGNLAAIARQNGMEMETCAEGIDLSAHGIVRGRCIDDRLIARITGCSVRAVRDRGQRAGCGCIRSTDIGVYNTCPSGCAYCYASYSGASVARNAAIHDPAGPMLLGRPGPDDTIAVPSAASLLLPRQQVLGE